jgi:hypothetical protein
MTKQHELEEAATILSGYEAWRRAETLRIEQDGYLLSVSHYLDTLAQLRQTEALNELRDLFSEDGFDLTANDVITQARAILGIE